MIAHSNGFFRTEVGTPATVSAAGGIIEENPDFLTNIAQKDGSGRTVAGTAGAANALGMIPDRLATETGWSWPGFKG